MLDSDIRKAIKSELLSCHSQLLLVDEVELCGGDVRADLAAFNGVMAGYEIKSPADSLIRLSRQITGYNQIFEHSVLVASHKHLLKAKDILPDWWGMYAAASNNGDVHIQRIKPPQPNPIIDSHSVAMMLWRREALRVLESLGINRGVKTKPMTCLASRLCEHLTTAQVVRLVRETIKARGNWRSASKHKRCAERSQQRPNASGQMGLRRRKGQVRTVTLLDAAQPSGHVPPAESRPRGVTAIEQSRTDH